MKALLCPNCKKETVWRENPWRPFCSERCKQLDLQNWIEGQYAVPAVEGDSGDGNNAGDKEV